MKKLFLYSALQMTFILNAQVGIGTNTPNYDSALEINSSNKGILITRINLVDTNLANPLNNHVKGMIIYNLNTNGTGNTAVSPGFYYNDGIKWIKLEPISINIGDIKHSLNTNDHLGWYKLDGRLISTLPSLAENNAISLGFLTNLPNTEDRILKGKTNLETIGSIGGNNSISLTQANLPNVDFYGTTSLEGNHTHNYIDRHNSNFEEINVVYGLLGILSGVVLNILNTNVGNKTSQTNLSNSSINGDHTHTVSVSSGGSNTTLPNAKTISTNTFVYLGE